MILREQCSFLESGLRLQAGKCNSQTCFCYVGYRYLAALCHRIFPQPYIGMQSVQIIEEISKIFAKNQKMIAIW